MMGPALCFGRDSWNYNRAQAGDARVQDRVAFYQRYTTILGVTPGDVVDCGAMSPY